MESTHSRGMMKGNTLQDKFSLLARHVRFHCVVCRECATMHLYEEWAKKIYG
ncbi:hypothetical protein BRCON_0335 [Candidatus Sumerlaea chitinivorans]|uniref:Uncharacterized protein n=1 Tax=Sumerlaea chitinivorans TaxID=2250252 RepID=A0A2Z4Y305_SUMC1|nr:hypothetical protein BRCON_0335 [Candidatus Sumerlaea chitinivorans]